MWVFATHGVYSVVCARRGAGGWDQPVDPDRVMIRARVRGHLDGLIDRFPVLAGGGIIETPAADYRWRVIVSKADWADALRELALDTDYDNFKNAAKAELGEQGHRYYAVLAEVWAAGHRLQHDSVRADEHD